MPAALIEVLILLALILLNGVFALSEMAIVSARKARLEQLAQAGDARARAALRLSNDPSQFLSTVQVGITLVGILSGAFGGATLAGVVAAPIRDLPVVGPYGDVLGLTLVVLAIAFLTLILGELVPKRLALTSPERLAMIVAGPMRALAGLAGPAVGVLTSTTELALRLLGIRSQPATPVSEEEVRILIEQGRQAGVFNAAEQETIDRVLRFTDSRAITLMTPRREVAWLDVEHAPDDVAAFLRETPHGKFPLCEGALDNVVGVITARALLQATSVGQPLDLRQLALPPVFVPESMEGFRVLETFRQQRVEMAMVMDEYGGLQGIVTLTDVLEAIVGDVPAADEVLDPDVVLRTDGSWLVDGMVSLEELQATVGLPELPREAAEEVNTLGGLMLLWLQRIPRAGDVHLWGEWRFEVMDMDHRRVDKVLITHRAGGSPDVAC